MDMVTASDWSITSMVQDAFDIIVQVSVSVCAFTNTARKVISNAGAPNVRRSNGLYSDWWSFNGRRGWMSRIRTARS